MTKLKLDISNETTKRIWETIMKARDSLEPWPFEEKVRAELEQSDIRAERDEARAECTRLREALSASHDRAEAEMGWFVQAIRERDEARAEVERLREVLKSVADGDGIHVGRDEMGLFCAACGKRGLGNDHFDSCPVTVARAALALASDALKKGE